MIISRAAFLPMACTAVLTACATPSSSNATRVFADASLSDSSGKIVGMARVVGKGMQARLVAKVTGLTPGEHGIHLHTTGKCEAPGFTSAGGHLNPTAHQHGAMNPAGPHLGDLPNISVAADGTGSVDAPIADGVAALMPLLFDADGTAVVVHAGPDDYKTDPSGNSGGRIACGVLSPAK